MNKQTGTTKKSLTLKAYNVATNRPISAEIYRNGRFTGHQTPYTFSEAEFLPGDYSCQKAGFTNWMPQVITVNTLLATVAYTYFASSVS
jgi:hypothetical protein